MSNQTEHDKILARVANDFPWYEPDILESLLGMKTFSNVIHKEKVRNLLECQQNATFYGLGTSKNEHNDGSSAEEKYKVWTEKYVIAREEVAELGLRDKQLARMEAFIRGAITVIKVIDDNGVPDRALIRSLMTDIHPPLKEGEKIPEKNYEGDLFVPACRFVPRQNYN